MWVIERESGPYKFVFSVYMHFVALCCYSWLKFFSLFILVMSNPNLSPNSLKLVITFIYFYGISIYPNVLYGVILKTKCVCSLEWREKIASFLYSVQFKNIAKKNQCNFSHYQVNLVFAGTEFWQDCNWVYSEFYQCVQEG